MICQSDLHRAPSLDRVDASVPSGRRLQPVSLLCAVALALTGCDLLGGEDDAPPPPAPDPALAPAEAAPQPEPTGGRQEPTRGTQQPAGDEPQASGGTFTLPGLEGLPIPLPAPREDHPEPEPPARGSLPAVAPGTVDANGFMTREFLEQETESIHRALLAALDEHENGQVSDIPLSIVTEHRQPNAAAGCTNNRRAVMMITTAMLQLAAGISEAKAYDEVAETETYEEYVATVVSQVRNQEPIRGVSETAHRAPHATDPHKLSRQRHLFAQQIAFILGHELAHHYRGHTNCVDDRTDAEIQRDQLSQLLAHTVPPFSQPREVEADMWGITNVLEAGRDRHEGTWSEEGSLLNLDFFRRLGDRGGAELVLAFLSTHPPSVLRIPIVQSTAQQWSPGWRPPRMPVPGQSQGPIELPTPAGTLRLPDPGQLPIDPSQLPLPLPRRR